MLLPLYFAVWELFWLLDLSNFWVLWTGQFALLIFFFSFFTCSRPGKQIFDFMQMKLRSQLVLLPKRVFDCQSCLCLPVFYLFLRFLLCIILVSLYLSIYMSVCMSVYCPSIDIYTSSLCLFIHVHSYIYLSVCVCSTYMYPYIILVSFRPSIHPFVCLSVCCSSIYLCIILVSVHLFIHCMSVFLLSIHI